MGGWGFGVGGSVTRPWLQCGKDGAMTHREQHKLSSAEPFYHELSFKSVKVDAHSNFQQIRSIVDCQVCDGKGWYPIGNERGKCGSCKETGKVKREVRSPSDEWKRDKRIKIRERIAELNEVISGLGSGTGSTRKQECLGEVELLKHRLTRLT